MKSILTQIYPTTVCHTKLVVSKYQINFSVVRLSELIYTSLEGVRQKVDGYGYGYGDELNVLEGVAGMQKAVFKKTMQ